MSSIVMNKVITEKKERTENASLFERIGRYIAETSEVMAPGVFAMNNTYYRPVKQYGIEAAFQNLQNHNRKIAR